MSADDEVFSEEEQQQNLTYSLSAVTKKSYESPVKTTDEVSAKKKGTTSKTSAAAVAKHPTYVEMVQGAVLELGGRKGVSKARITGYMKNIYELDEVNNVHVVKAIRGALEKKIIENITGTGASGSFKITKDFKEVLKKQEAAKLKKEKAKLKKESQNADVANGDEKEGKVKPKVTRAKDDMELLKQKKKLTKKPPVPKGKENKPTASAAKGSQKILKEKVKTLKKANSTGALKKKIAESLPQEIEPATESIVQKKKTASKRKAK